jgi:hypothetical protein
MFPLIFMHGEKGSEVVDIKDKGFSGKVIYEMPDPKNPEKALHGNLKIMGELNDSESKEFYIATEQAEGLLGQNIMVVRLI